MSINSIDNYGGATTNQLLQLSKEFGEKVRQIDQVNTEQAAGQRYSEYYDIPDLTTRAQLASIVQGLNVAESNVKLLEGVKGTMNGISSSLGDILALIQDVQTQLIETEGFIKLNDIDIRGYAKNALGDLKALLNTNINGKYIYAGGGDQKPVHNIDNPNQIFITNFTTRNGMISSNQEPSYQYYHGGEARNITMIQGEVVEYGINGNDESIAKAIAALNMIAYDPSLDRKVGDSTLINPEIVQKIQEMLQSSTQGLNAVQYNLSCTIQRVNKALERENSNIQLLAKEYTNINGFDNGDIAASAAQTQALSLESTSLLAAIKNMGLILTKYIESLF